MSEPHIIRTEEADNTTPVYTEWQMEAILSVLRGLVVLDEHDSPKLTTTGSNILRVQS